jgi:hypothetical protein
MSMQAVAIVRIDAGSVRGALASAGGEDQRVGANGEAFRIVALDDATLVHLELGIGSEPSELAARIRELLGELLDQHDEPRGVPVYPSSYALQARTWAAAIEELGEAADWVKVEEQLPGLAGMGDMLRAFGLDAGDLAEMGKHLAAPGGNEDVFAAAMRAAQEMSERGAFKDLAERMRGMGIGDDPQKLLEQMGGASGLGGMGGLDLEALTRQAQRMLNENPELAEQLSKALEGADDGEDDDE